MTSASPSGAVPGRESRPLAGIACMLVGVALLTLSDAAAKWFTAEYPVGQVVAIRAVFILGFIVILTGWRSGLRELQVFSLRKHMVRAAFACASTFFFVLGLAVLPLADAIAVTFAGPLFVTALAPLLLAETVGWRRWLAVLAGFAGVLLMVRPAGDYVRWAIMLPLMATLAGALRDLVTRRISTSEHSSAILFTTNAVVLVAALFTLPFGWRPPAVVDLLLLGCAGALMGVAHYLHIEAFRLAEAAVVAPFRYTNMIWGVVLGLLVWGQLPDRWVIGGSALVMTSGLFIYYRERRVAAAKMPVL